MGIELAPLPVENYHRPRLQRERTLAAALVEHLASLGVEHAFGIIGGGIGVLFDALEESRIDTHHFRHESGAAFAAAESSLASGRPVVVYTTTGPGLLNALTGISAGRWEGAQLIVLSGATGPLQRGRWATQETSAYTLPQDALYGRGPLFDFATRMESVAELPEVLRRLEMGVAQPAGYVAHIGLPISLQASTVELRPRQRPAQRTVATPHPEDVEQCARLLATEPFVIWLGFGARKAAGRVRALAERTGARVMASPRAKGIFPEDHPLYLGVTGLGGHAEVNRHLERHRPRWTLVLGSRLGEATSYWDEVFEPAEGFIHVDLDPTVPGVAYPECLAIGVQADIDRFLGALLTHIPEPEMPPPTWHPAPHHEEPESTDLRDSGPVRPQMVMEALQRRVINGSDALLMAECGNAFAWSSHYLRFPAPGRYRSSTLFGSMGHCAAGVVGAVLGRRGKAVAVVGDGSMLMNCEISTAVQYRVDAVWVVLNDSGYGMCQSGQSALGLASNHLAIPTVDFVTLARSMGADGVRVETEDMLDVAFCQALAAKGPFVVDIRIDANEASPLTSRFESLLRQGSSKTVAGWGLPD